MSLFWKFFVTFGIALALTLVGAVLVSYRLTSTAFDQQNIANRDEVIAEAARELAEHGAVGLVGWLKDNQNPSPGISLMVLDESGTELLGRALPDRFARIIERGPPRRAGPGPPNLRPPRLTASLVAADGREFRLLFVRTRITLLGILSWPATQLAVLALVGLAAALTSLLLARYLSSPIARLQKASRSLAAGRLDTRVGSPFNQRGDEVGQLAKDFDAMAERIQGLILDKELLLRDVSHELRSPLARIRVALALAERRADSGAQADLRRIEQETERLEELVGKIMTLARLRTEPVKRRLRLHIAALLKEVVENARFEHPDAAIELIADSAPAIMGDASELRSAFENVIRNALAHSDPPQAVTVRVETEPGWLDISVADHGPGVPEADLPKLFEPFFRSDQSRDHQRNGQGIGLAITARVLERHAGSCSARNRVEGGLEVTLRLPLDA